MRNNVLKQKILILLLLILLGLLTEFYTGPGSRLVNNHLGGVIYVVFFIFGASLVFPRTRYQNKLDCFYLCIGIHPIDTNRFPQPA